MATTEMNIHYIEKISISELRDFGSFQSRTITIVHGNKQQFDLLLFSNDHVGGLPEIQIDNSTRECFTKVLK